MVTTLDEDDGNGGMVDDDAAIDAAKIIKTVKNIHPVEPCDDGGVCGLGTGGSAAHRPRVGRDFGTSSAAVSRIGAAGTITTICTARRSVPRSTCRPLTVAILGTLYLGLSGACDHSTIICACAADPAIQPV